jgi:hypothetical protein
VAQPDLARRAASRPRVASLASQRRVSLCETLDRVLNKGAVVAGDIVISVAGVDLLYLGVNLVLTSVETMRHWDTRNPGLQAPALDPGPAPAPVLEEHP